MEETATSYNSAGSLIGAVLESMGYHFQAHALDTLSDPLTNEVGGLIYLVGLVLAVAITATQGKYKMGIWLLIGPPLFFSVIIPRASIPNARWRFGYEDRDVNGKVDSEVQERMQRSNSALSDANVSKVFKRYVEMVGVSTQHIVGTIAKYRNKTDIWMQVRGELFAMLHTGRVEDPFLMRLMQLSLFGHCHNVIRLGRAAQDPLFRERYNAEKNEIDQTPEAQDSKPYHLASLEEARREFEREYERAEITLDRDAARKVAELEITYEYYQRAREQGIGSDTIPWEQAGESGEMLDEIEKRKEKIMKEVNFSCRHIWYWTLLGLADYANRQLDYILRKGESMNIDRRVMENLIAQLHGLRGEEGGREGGGPIVYHTARPDPEAEEEQEGELPTPDLTNIDVRNLIRLISKYYLRNEWQGHTKSAWMAYFNSRLENRDLVTSLQGRNSFTEQARVGVREWSEKERLILAAGTLPYYQGLLLYFLGTAFPFFALVLLVPGKQSGFMLWFLLWLWVKSWDIGMAIVMVLDDMFFSMMAVQKQTIKHISGKTEAVPANEELNFAFATLAEMDPTFQLATYYTVIAVCILAIPVTSAQLLLGGMRGGASIVSAGMEKSTDFFAEHVRQGTGQVAITGLKLQARHLKMEQARAYQRNVQLGREMTAGVPDKGKGTSQFNPADPEYTPITDYGRTAGGAQGGPTGRPGSGMRYSAARQRLGRHAAAQGAGEGLHSLDRQMGPGRSPYLEGAFQAGTARSRLMSGVRWQQGLALWSSDKRAVAAHAQWDADIMQQAVDTYEQIALYGGLPIPWSTFTSESSGEEFELALQRFEYEQKLKVAEWQVAREMMQGFRKIAEATIKDMKLEKPPDVKTWDDLQKLPPNVQQEIRRRYGTYITQNNQFRRIAIDGVGMFGTAGIGYHLNQQSIYNVMGPRPEPVDPALVPFAVSNPTERRYGEVSGITPMDPRKTRTPGVPSDLLDEDK